MAPSTKRQASSASRRLPRHQNTKHQASCNLRNLTAVQTFIWLPRRLMSVYSTAAAGPFMLSLPMMIACSHSSYSNSIGIARG